MIRGTSDNLISADFMIDVGMAIGREYREVAICTDNRASSRILCDAFIAGVLHTGATVYDNGVLPPTALPFSDCSSKVGLSIGNPDDENDVGGFNLMNMDGTYFSATQLLRFNENLNSDPYHYRNPGTSVEMTGTMERYMNRLLQESRPSDIQIVLDCYSNAIHRMLPRLLSDKGAEVTVLDHHVLSSRAANNDRSDLKSLFKAVKANYGSIGVALNRDGTIARGIDENGDYIDGTRMFAMFLKFLRPSSVALPIDTSLAVTDALDTEYIFTPLNPTSLGEYVKEYKAQFGGSSIGSFIFPSISYCPDGLMTSSVLCSLATEYGLSAILEGEHEYHSLESTYRFKDNPVIISRRLDESVQALDVGNIAKVDGWRVDYDEGWFLIRVVDQAVKIKVESRDKAYATGLMEIAIELVEESMRNINK